MLWMERHHEPGMLEHTLHWTIAKCNSLGIFCRSMVLMATNRWATGFYMRLFGTLLREGSNGRTTNSHRDSRWLEFSCFYPIGLLRRLKPGCEARRASRPGKPRRISMGPTAKPNRETRESLPLTDLRPLPRTPAWEGWHR